MDDDDWYITGLLAGSCVVLGVILLVADIYWFIRRRLWPKRWQ